MEMNENDAEKYIQELEEIKKALDSIKDKISTWHGKNAYVRFVKQTEMLLELNKESYEKNGTAGYLLNY